MSTGRACEAELRSLGAAGRRAAREGEGIDRAASRAKTAARDVPVAGGAAGDAFGSLAEQVQATITRRLAGGKETKTLFAASAPATGAGRVVVGNSGDTGYELTFRIAPPGTDSLSGGGV